MTDLEKTISSSIEDMKNLEIGNNPATEKHLYRITYCYREAGGGTGNSYEVWSDKWPNPPSNPRNHGEYVEVTLIQ